MNDSLICEHTALDRSAGLTLLTEKQIEHNNHRNHHHQHDNKYLIERILSGFLGLCRFAFLDAAPAAIDAAVGPLAEVFQNPFFQVS